MLIVAVSSIGALQLRAVEPGQEVDRHELRILSPRMLEMYAVVARTVNGGSEDEIWNFSSKNGTLTLPPDSDFSVLVNGVEQTKTRIGFRRMAVFAEKLKWDLRMGVSICIELQNPVPNGAVVKVLSANPDIVPAGWKFEAVADPLRETPVIHANQEGYGIGLPKRAMVGFYLGNLGELPLTGFTSFELRDADSMAVVHTGTLKARLDVGFTISPQPYQQVLEADFSSFDTAGRYVLAVPGIGISLPFRIHNGHAALVARTLALGVFHQRSGHDKNMPFTRLYHPADHTLPAFIPNMTSEFDKANEILAAFPESIGSNPLQTAPLLTAFDKGLFPYVNTAPVDVSGGHFDAGDYSKYIFNSNEAAHVLGFAIDNFPGVAQLDNLGIPESGDGTGDVLQEMKWETDYIAKMQDADGGFYFLVYPKARKYEHDIPPHLGDRQIVYPKTTIATATATAVLAEVGSSPTFKAKYPETAAMYLSKAQAGWNFLMNAIATHGKDGAYQTINHYGMQWGHNDELAWAAAAMFAATGEEQYHAKLKEWFPDPNASSTRRWTWWKLYQCYGSAIRTYAFAVRSGRLPPGSLDAAYLTKCENEIIAAGNDVWIRSRDCSYGTSINSSTKRQQSPGWFFPTSMAFDAVTAHVLQPSANLLSAVVSNIDYEYGVNPVNRCFVPGIGYNRQTQMVANLDSGQRRSLPPTGIMIGSMFSGVSFSGPYESAEGSEFRAINFPSTNYPIYDRWTNVYNVATEQTINELCRALATSAWLFARSPIASQPWKVEHAATITGLPASIPYGTKATLGLTHSTLDLSQASIVWETGDGVLAYGPTLDYERLRGLNNWIEAEGHLPDGRRFFAKLNLENTPAPPFLDLGTKIKTVALPQTSLPLAATITPDGTTETPVLKWELVSGPGRAWFSNDSAPVTELYFLEPGDYTVRATVSVEGYSRSKEIVVSVQPSAQPLSNGTPLPADPGTLALYRMDGTGSDSSGRGFHLSTSGNTTFTSENLLWMRRPNGMAARFKQLGDTLKVQIPDAQVQPGSQSALCIEAWIFIRNHLTYSFGNYPLFSLYQHWDSSLEAIGSLWGDSQNRKFGRILCGTTQLINEAKWEQLLPSRTWHKLSLVYDGTGIARVYRNGVLIASAPPQYYNRVRTTNWTLTLGNFDGDIDDVRISTIARSGTEGVVSADGSPLRLRVLYSGAGNATISWNPVTDAYAYRMDVATDSAFLNLVPGYQNTEILGTSIGLNGLLGNQTYHLRIRPFNFRGVPLTSGWSNYSLRALPQAGGWGITRYDPEGDPAVTLETSHLGIFRGAADLPWMPTHRVFRGLGYSGLGVGKVYSPGNGTATGSDGTGLRLVDAVEAFRFSASQGNASVGAASIQSAMTDGEYLKFTIVPPSGETLNLRGQKLTIWWRRNSQESAKGLAVFTSLGGFAAGQHIHATTSTPEPGVLTETVVDLPNSPAYALIAGPLEFRLAFHAGGETGETLLSGILLTRNTAQPPVVAPASLKAVHGASFEFFLSATNMPNGFSLVAGSLPQGLSLNGTAGRIFGTPLQLGNFSVSVTASNDQGDSLPVSIPLVVDSPPKPVLTSSNSTTGMAGIFFSHQISALHGPWTFSAPLGLPGGLTLNSTTGLLSGIPTTAGSYDTKIRITNIAGNTDYTLGISINQGVPFITSAGNLTLRIGEAANYRITASYAPTSFSATGLPAGLSVNLTTGIFSGAPMAAGNATATLFATNSSGNGTKELQITILPALPVITSPSSTSGSVATAFSFQIQATNNPTGFAISRLPLGLTLNSSTGLIAGTPTYAGNVTGNITVTNAGGSVNQNLVFAIAPAVPVISSSNNATGRVGRPFSHQVAALYGPTSFAASGLPAGLSINATSGLVMGTPLSVGNASITLSASNAAGSGQQLFTLRILGELPVFSSNSSASGAAGVSFLHQLAATNSPTSFTASGLPSGLTLNATTGIVSGKPRSSGNFLIKFQATNVWGSAFQNFTLVVSPSAPVISSPTTATGAVGVPFTYRILALNSPTSFGANGLPAGLSINASNGTISGTPEAIGNTTVTISAGNAVGTTTGNLLITILPSAPVITSIASISGQAGIPLSHSISATNGPHTFGATGLPLGLTLNRTTGLLSGAPALDGISIAKITAKNSVGTATQNLTISIAPSVPAITSNASANARVGQPFNFQLAGLYRPNSFGATGLPPGLSVNATSGLVSGTPATSGNVSVTFSASNAAGTGTQNFTLRVLAALPVFTSNASASAAVGSLFSHQIVATNSPTSLRAIGLPSGLSINATTGLVVGRPRVDGVFVVQLYAVNAGGSTLQNFTLTISPATPVINSPLTVSGQAGIAFTYRITAANNPVTFGAIGLPVGLSLNSANGTISGTPLASGTSTATISAGNAAGTDTKSLVLNIAP